MKKVYLLFCLLCITVVAAAQLNNTLNVSFGPAFPTGKFASTQNDDVSAFAKTGLSLNVGYTHRWRNGLGLEVSVIGQSNGIKSNDMAQRLSESIGIPGIGSGIDWHVDDGNWRSVSAMAGLSQTINLSSSPGKLLLIPKLMAGITHLRSPAIKGEGRLPDDYVVYTQDKSKSTGPSILISSLMNYQLSSRFSLYFDLGYFTTTKLTFKDVPAAAAATDGLVIPGLYTLTNSRNPPRMAKMAGDLNSR